MEGGTEISAQLPAEIFRTLKTDKTGQNAAFLDEVETKTAIGIWCFPISFPVFFIHPQDILTKSCEEIKQYPIQFVIYGN